MDIFFSILINFTYIFSGILGISHFLELRKNCGINLLISAFLCVSQAFLIFMNNPMLNTLSALALIFITTLICFKCDRKVFIIYDILIFISAFISDILATICLSVVSRNTITSVLQQQDITISRRILNCIFIFILCSISFNLIRKKQSSPVRYEVIFYTVLAVGETFTTYFMVINIQDDSSGGFIILFLSGCFLLDIYIAFMFHRISVVRKTEKENALLRQQSDLQMSVYRDLQKRYERSMKIIHDAKKHVTALESLIQSENTEEAMNYKKSLYQEFDKLQLSFQHKNKILTVIINNELIKAENYNIKMQLIIDDIDMEFLSDIDITTIVSNVLDNAIEAVSELPEEKRNILFIIKEKMNCLVIHAENPYKNIEQSKNRFLSTKNGHLGIGLKNIESVVNKYNGIFSVDISDENFVNLITIPYKK